MTADALKQTLELQDLYLAREVSDVIKVETPVNMNAFHLDILEPNTFKSVKVAGPDGKSQYFTKRLIFNHSELSKDDRDLAIDFIHNCHEKGRDITSKDMIESYGSIVPLLLRYGVGGHFNSEPLQGQALYDRVMEKLVRLKDDRLETGVLSDTDPAIRKLLDAGAFSWVGVDKHNAPVLKVDCQGDWMRGDGMDVETAVRAFKFCIEWAKRYLFIPGRQETAVLVINFLSRDPHTFLPSSIRDAIIQLSDADTSRYFNKVIVLNDSFHWRTLWDVTRPMLSTSDQAKISFMSSPAELYKSLPNDIARNFLERTPYPWPCFGIPVDNGPADTFTNLKQMRGCPWILGQVPPGLAMDPKDLPSLGYPESQHLLATLIPGAVVAGAAVAATGALSRATTNGRLRAGDQCGAPGIIGASTESSKDISRSSSSMHENANLREAAGVGAILAMGAGPVAEEMHDHLESPKKKHHHRGRHGRTPKNFAKSGNFASHTSSSTRGDIGTPVAIAATAAVGAGVVGGVVGGAALGRAFDSSSSSSDRKKGRLAKGKKSSSSSSSESEGARILNTGRGSASSVRARSSNQSPSTPRWLDSSGMERTNGGNWLSYRQGHGLRDHSTYRGHNKSRMRRWFNC